MNVVGNIFERRPCQLRVNFDVSNSLRFLRDRSYGSVLGVEFTLLVDNEKR